MNTKKITISFIAITLSLALVQFSLAPLAIASQPLPPNIHGIVYSSQGKEVSYSGEFHITGISSKAEGLFSAMLSYSVYGGPQGNFIDTSTPINGVYTTSRTGSINIQFTGDTEGIRGQMKTDPRAEGKFVGFITNPGNGYLTQVFVIENP